MPDVSKILQDLSGFAGMVLILALAGLTLFLLGKLRDKLFGWIVNTWRNGIMKPGVSKMHRKVNDTLHELRARYGAARACVFQFHNGEVFMMSDHSWKATCTHEAVDHGITFTSRQNSNLLVSSLVDFIEPIVTGEHTKTTGAYRLDICEQNQTHCPMARRGHWVIGYDIDQMEVSMSRYLAEEQGVTYVYAVNLVGSNKATFGFVSIQFKNLSPEKKAQIEKDICALCSAAERIQLMLTGRIR